MMSTLPPSMSVSAKVSVMPMTSVFSPISHPSSFMIVFIAPTVSTVDDTESICDTASCLCGMVTFIPLMPYPMMTSLICARSGLPNLR